MSVADVEMMMNRPAKLLSVLVIATTSLSLHGAANHTFTTALQSVHTSSIDGRELLTIEIDSEVGPPNCHGNVLRVAADTLNHSGKQLAMENIALEAMLTSEPVVITVPLTWNECVDGLPTLTDINLVSPSQ